MTFDIHMEEAIEKRFKNYLRKIASGEKTSRGLSREESADALKAILTGKASPAQIGAFFIAHRIRRPEPQELAGMLDTYLSLGPKLKSVNNQRAPICFGMPFDGRKRTTPIYPLTTLVLLSANQPIVLQGGGKMPIKYGITTSELFKSLSLNVTGSTIHQVQTGFDKNGLAIIHQPDHFKLAEGIINYRDEIGKRPPIASMELIWTAHQGKHILISGYVHPPTEARAWKALDIIGENNIITIKGLEGSIDLPTSRACITARVQNKNIERLILHPRDYNCHSSDIEWKSVPEWSAHALQALENKGPLKTALYWNAGVYLWFSGLTKTLKEGIELTESLLSSGETLKKLSELIKWENLRQ